MKKNLKFVYTLLIILVFINCTAKDKDNMKSKQIYGNVQQDKTETIIQK